MPVCTNCGRSFEVISRECPYCHTRLTSESVVSQKNLKKVSNDYDYKDNTLLLISSFVPLLGYIYYFVNKENSPLKSSSALGGALINTIIIAVIIVSILILNLIK